MRTYFHVKGGRLEEVRGEVVREQPLTVHVNEERFRRSTPSLAHLLPPEEQQGEIRA